MNGIMRLFTLKKPSLVIPGTTSITVVPLSEASGWMRFNSNSIPFNELLPCPYNRAVDQAKVFWIVKQITETQDIKPFVVVEIRTDKGLKFMITDGHHRFEALKLLIKQGALASTVRVPYVLSGTEGTRSAADQRPARLNAVTKALPPIIDKLPYSVPVARSIERVFWENLYRPLLASIDPSFETVKAPELTTTASESARLPGLTNRLVSNGKAYFKRALMSGRVQYVDGYVYGEFNANIGSDIVSLGGRFDKVKKAYALPLSNLPQDLRQAIATSKIRSDEAQKRVQKTLDGLQNREPGVPKAQREAISEQFNRVITDLDGQFAKTVADEISVPIETPPAMREALRVGYSENLDLDIKKWEDEDVLRLRKIVEKNFREGYRSDRLVGDILSDWGVARRKAEFLARQETSLLVSKYRKERYADAGITRYRWSTSHDMRVRHDHRELNGHVFEFSNPPVTDKNSGARNNPGEDFNCRCVAIPVFSESARMAKEKAA